MGVIDKIRAKGHTVSGFADQIGIDRETIRRIDGGQADPRVSTIITIARALGCRTVDVWPGLGE